MLALLGRAEAGWAQSVRPVSSASGIGVLKVALVTSLNFGEILIQKSRNQHLQAGFHLLKLLNL